MGKNLISIDKKDVAPLFAMVLSSVREDIRENTYILEAIKVLPVGGYRSAIGSFWNAVVDDLRNKIIHRSLALFNKEVTLSREIKIYEDFQNYVNDDQLIEGAYKIGVIGWEASKILKHAKETRHIFDGHPKSSEPSFLKVLAMMDDCIKYVLNEDYPSQIIDIDDYMTILSSADFDRNEIAIENALGELPETYKNELANRIFTSYVHPAAASELRSNIEFTIPILWGVLPKDVKKQIIRRVDQVIQESNIAKTEQAFKFAEIVDGVQYLSTSARKYKLKSLIEKLTTNLDEFKVENTVVSELLPYAPVIPAEFAKKYVSALTHTYVGHMGSSSMWSRKDFYANSAALLIPKMFQSFDDNAASAFVETIRESELLKSRIRTPAKLRRLRALGNIVLEKASRKFKDKDFLEALTDEQNEELFYRTLSISPK